ncbi:uncharacterized protein LOC124662520 [Lolium rigidum]|uniref:uncharacterized protein LOC124662520 n=1 Tax=Lolium rigidum TaxID=89674 RepID=UPI001F5D416D|nr:uncharacterized protein LOC124662520 [Lolium rigidum]
MADGAKRIDLGAPLRSAVRPPCHKPDLNSGPLRHPGAVPFVWEQSPGRPKSVRTRRAAPPSPSPAPSPHHPRPSEDEGAGGATPYHDALCLAEREHSPLYPDPAPAAAAPQNRPTGRKVEWAEADAKAPEALLSVADVLRNQDEDAAGDDEERFSDAQDTLSRTESFTVNCSVSGLSGAPPDRPGPAAGAAAPPDPDARGFMMDRFLPAAQAVAVGSPQYTFRKAGAGSSAREHAHASWRAGGDDDRARRTPVQLPYQHLPPNYLSCNYPRREDPVEEEDDDDCDDVQSTRGFASKGCGLLPGLCVKTSLLLLNPVPAMKNGKARGRGRGRGLPSKGRGQNAPSPLARSSQNKNLGCDSNGRYWEEVYKHKLEQKYVHQAEDKRSKMTSESNHLTFWSDSQTGDGSSPFHQSIGGGASPYRRDVALSPSHKESVSFEVRDRDEKMSRSNGSSSLGIDHDHGSLVGSDHSSFKGSSSMSSGVDKTSHEDSMDHRAGIDSDTSHLALLPAPKPSLNTGSDVQLGGKPIVGSNSIAEVQDNGPSTERITEVLEPAVLMPRNAGLVKFDDTKTSTYDTSQDVPLRSEENIAIKKESRPLQYLMPLPVPKSPSDSWLSRNLPSVKNKPPAPSFLGIQVQPKKQAPWASAHPKENGLKPPRQRQIRFADVVERPNYVDTEI